MKRISLKVGGVAAVLLCLFAAFPAAAQSVDKFLANLPFDYAEGSAINIDAATKCCTGKLPTALFFNKSAPYLAFSVQNMYSPDPLFRELPVFQLRADEAIVVIGVTPPPAKFFSYMPYLLTRTYPPETTPRPIFASLGDSINVSTIKTLGPDPFSRPVVLIFTPDRGTDARIRATLRSAGYPDAIINTLPLPAPILQLGADRAGQPLTSDVFVILNRMARFSDKDAGKKYIDDMSADVSKRPLRVFRVTPAAGGALKPFPVQPLRIRGTGQSEMNLAPDLERLRQAILKNWDERGFKATEYHTKFVAYEGYEYIERRKDTLGDNRDSLYFGAGYLPIWDLEDELTLGQNDFLVAYGPKHVATGKATYTNINVYASETVMFSMASAYDDSFEGSAEEYLGHSDPAAGLLYVQNFAYPSHCTGTHCLPLEVPTDCKPWCETYPDCPIFILDASTKLGVYFRNYLEPPTRVGAAAGELLYDQVIKFSPK